MIAMETIAVAFAMFSAIPVPPPTWNERNMRYVMCAFPLVGVVCGLAYCLWAAICGYWPVPEWLQAAGYCLAPVLITGGIHLDGYADTCDALASYAEPVRKQEILKDPHCGAFALIRVCCYFVAYFALCASLEMERRTLMCLGLGFVLERVLSGWAVATFPIAKNTGLVHTFATAADRTTVRRVLGVLAVLLCLALAAAGGISGVAMVAAALLVLWRYRTVALKQFGGISGDLAGWFLQRGELWMLASLVVFPIVEGTV